MCLTIGILAYGSLIDDPGDEIGLLTTNRISCQTPFGVEFARTSRSRSGAPTLIPVDTNGAQVNAVILVLADGISLEEAKSMLWRREVRQKDRTKIYIEKKNPGPDTVQVKTIEDFEGIDFVLYTHIGQNISPLLPQVLAKLAIQSILGSAGDQRLDGIRYLLSAKHNGLITPLSDSYEAEILKQTETNNLTETIALLDEERPTYVTNSNNWNSFESTVKKLADLVGEYGLNKTLKDHPIVDTPFEDYHKEHFEEFTMNVHSGWKQAQNQILANLLMLEKESDMLKEKVKTAKSTKEKRFIRDYRSRLKLIEKKQDILKHLIDTIAWSMIGGQLYVARRIYQGTRGSNRLTKTNIASVMSVANKLNENPLDFALITDLSTYIQTGDLFVIRGGKRLEFIEVKEGQTNHKVLNLLGDLTNKAKSTDEIFHEIGNDTKTLEQLKRNLKQSYKSALIINILRNDKGEDEKGRQVNIITPEETTPLFDQTLSSMYERLKGNGLWAYDNIDGCLHIGMYTGAYMDAGHMILTSLAERNSSRFLFIDYISVLKSLHRPLFLSPFPKEFIFDILFHALNYILFWK